MKNIFHHDKNLFSSREKYFFVVMKIQQRSEACGALFTAIPPKQNYKQRK